MESYNRKKRAQRYYNPDLYPEEVGKLEDVIPLDEKGDGENKEQLPAVPTREESIEDETREEFEQEVQSAEDNIEEDNEIAEQTAPELEEMLQKVEPKEGIPAMDVPSAGNIDEAIEAAKANKWVMKIWYRPLGRKNTKRPRNKERRPLRRELKLKGQPLGEIWRFVEPHHRYTARGTGNDLIVCWDRSVRDIRSFIVKNITKYEFFENKKTNEPREFKMKPEVLPRHLRETPKYKEPQKVKIPKSAYRDNKMDNKMDNLIKIASALDSQGMTKNAEIVKDAYFAIRNFKIAQYVGSQGYWLRNRRCWDNCYRHKRTANPESSAQTVWNECWEEYKKSINDDNSGWEKYASQDSMTKLSKEDCKKWNKLFIQKVEEKVADNIPLPISIYTIIHDESKKHLSQALDGVRKLAEVVEELKKEGNEGSINEIQDIIQDIIKEAKIEGNPQEGWSAGFSPFVRGWEAVKNWWTGKGGKGDITKKLTNALARARELLNILNLNERPVFPTTTSSSKNGKVIIAVDKKNKGKFQPGNVPWNKKLTLAPEVAADPKGSSEYFKMLENQGVPTAPIPANKPVVSPSQNAPVKQRSPYNATYKKFYNSFIKDIAELARDMAPLRDSKDNKISTLVSNSLPHLNNIMNLEQKIVGTKDPAIQRDLLRQGLNDFITNVSMAMGGQSPAESPQVSPQQSQDVAEMSGQGNTARINQGNMPPANQGDAGWPPRGTAERIDPIDKFINSLNDINSLNRAAAKIQQKIQQIQKQTAQPKAAPPIAAPQIAASARHEYHISSDKNKNVNKK